MKRLMCLLHEILLDRGIWCGTSTDLDWKTVQVRVEAEGLSFLTITLPNFGSDLQKGLDQGFVDRHLFHGFAWKGGLPLFLRGFLGLIFDTSSGVLLDKPSIDAIQAVRQITLMFGKMKLPCTTIRERRALAKFVECEQQVRACDLSRTRADEAQFSKIAGMLWAPVLTKVDYDVYEGRLIPKHGPGSTADKLTGNRKFKQCMWTSRLELYFPHGEYLFSSWRHFDANRSDLLEPGSEMPVRVITVPKTLKTPRIIAVEPTCMQYAQQAVAEPLVRYLEGPENPYSSVVGFTDQEPNRSLACEGSRIGNLATLDLSEASDRVSNQLVRLLLSRHPHLAGAVDACRSRKADVAGHGVIRLAKFASMGSALCFPIEAVVFATIIFCGIETQLGRPLTRRDIESLAGKVRVYGDDIIVPVEYVHSVISRLEAFGLLVNADKSFWTGRFRESCGKEYYDGHDVSIVKVRTMFPTSQNDVLDLVSTVSLRNRLYQAGFWRTCKWMDVELKRLIPLPTIHPTSSLLGRHTFLEYETQRMCERLHTPLARGHVVSTVIPKNSLDGPDALLKWFIKRGELPLSRDHLVRSGRAHSVNTKVRWAQPF